MSTHWIAGGAVLLCGTAAWWDLRHHRIPNAITLPAVVSALCLHLVTNAGQGLLLCFRAMRWDSPGAGT